MPARPKARSRAKSTAKNPQLSERERGVLVDIAMMFDSMTAVAWRHYIPRNVSDETRAAAQIQNSYRGTLPWHPDGGSRSSDRTVNRDIERLHELGLVQFDGGRARARQVGLTLKGAKLVARWLGWPTLKESVRQMRRIARNPRRKLSECRLADLPISAAGRDAQRSQQFFRRRLEVLYAMMVPMMLCWVRVIHRTDGLRVYVLTPEGEAVAKRRVPADARAKADDAMLALEREAGNRWESTFRQMDPPDPSAILFGFGPGCRRALLNWHIKHARREI